MAKRKYKNNQNRDLSPAENTQVAEPEYQSMEEMLVREQERREEEARVRKVKQMMQTNRLADILDAQNEKKILYYPYAVGFVGLLVLLLYFVVKSHCFIDFPLFIVLAVVSVTVLLLTIRENRRLCDRIEDMLEERRHS